MATKLKDATEIKFMTANDIKERFGMGINQARALVRQLIGELEAKGYIIIPHRVPEAYVMERLVYKGVKN